MGGGVPAYFLGESGRAVVFVLVDWSEVPLDAFWLEGGGVWVADGVGGGGRGETGGKFADFGGGAEVEDVFDVVGFGQLGVSFWGEKLGVGAAVD